MFRYQPIVILQYNQTAVSSGLIKYTHIQSTASDTWTINHNLNTQPLILLTDETMQQIFGSIYFPNYNQAVVKFSIPVRGIAYCI
jgi:hypothetical protein